MNNQMGNYNQNYNQNYNRGYNQMNNNNSKDRAELRKKMIISVLGLAILIVAIIGISFAAYRNIIVTKNQNSISSGKVTVSFTEDNNAINMKNAIPVSDEKGKTMDDNSFDFAVTTSASSSLKVPYTISITTGEESTLDDSYVKMYLLKDGKEVVGPISVSSLTNFTARENTKELYKTTDIFNDDSDKKTTKYTLKMWIDKDFSLSDDSAKTYSMKVNVDSSMVGE